MPEGQDLIRLDRPRLVSEAPFGLLVDMWWEYPQPVGDRLSFFCGFVGWFLRVAGYNVRTHAAVCAPGPNSTGVPQHLSKGPALPKLISCALVVVATSLLLGATPALADSSPAAVPTHECNKWNFSSSAHEGSHAYGANYVVKNNVWNPVDIHQTIYSCDYDSFYVEANVKDKGGAVQSYPSSQYTFSKPVDIAKFGSLTSAFRISHPPTGSGFDYEYAYDIWIDGYGGNDHTELMIWNYTHGQRPEGRRLSSRVSLDGQVFEVWKNGEFGHGGDVVTFEAVRNYSSGNTHLLSFFQYAASHGWLKQGLSTRLWQIDYGAELCGTPRTTRFDFTDFDVSFSM
jgi:Glycosyl hydrolase family 12